MKKFIALPLILALLVSICSCTAVPTDESTVTTSSAESSANQRLQIGNFLYDRSSFRSVEKLTDMSYLITFDNGAYVTLIAENVSDLDKPMVESYLSAYTEALIDEDEYRVGEFNFDIALPDFDLVATYYTAIDSNNDITCNIDCVFTDTWYAYSLSYVISDSVQDLSAAGVLFGSFLRNGTYIGDAPRFDLIQLDSVTSETEPPATEPPETEPPATKPAETDPVVTYKDVSETVYAKGNVNVRSGPGTDYTKLGKLSKDDSVKRTGIGDNGWSRVEYNGKTAYISSEYLSTTKPSTTENKPVETDPPATESNVTKGMKNALSSAKSYLRFTAFSYNGLIDQLEYEGYTHDEAVYAADNCGADWKEQALKSAKNYLDVTAFSYSGLIEQLEYEEFTSSQAKYAVDNCGADWFEQAAKCAENYLDFMSFSRSGLIDQLIYEGFTQEQAEYGADSVGLT